MRRIFAILALFVVLGFVSGCYSVTEKVTQEQVQKAIEAKAAANNEDVEIDGDNKGMTIKTTTEDGDAEVTVKSNMKNTGDWCAEGSNWNYQGTSDAGSANAEWKIIGMINSGEYNGLCHVKYTATTPQGDTVMDYYFSEDGKSGYFEMDMNGQKIKQEWSN